MPQPSTFLIDSTNPTEQSWAWAQPIFWTSGRTYALIPQVPVSAQKAAFYLSLDGGATWTPPDLAHAQVCKAFVDYYFDGVSNVINMLLIANNSGVQPLVLVNFDLNAEMYSPTYGSSGAPTDTFVGPVRVARTSDNHLICFYSRNSGGGNSRARCAIYDITGATWGSPFDYATDMPAGGSTQNETIIPDPSNNLVHVFYSDNVGGNFSYRQITSAGALGSITAFPSGWNIHVGFLNQGRAFGAGYLKSGVLTVPVFTVDPITDIQSLAVITGTPSSAPSFSISAPIETAATSTEGWDQGQAIAYQVGSVQHVLYFAGDGLGNLYNLVKLASNSGSGWTTTEIYDATVDPNAGKNIHNNQWLNAISGGPDPTGGSQFQIATWLTLAGQAFQNTAELSTQFTGSSSLTLNCGSPPNGQVGAHYSSALIASGGTPPYTFALSSGSLPPGLSLNGSTGVIAGTPSAGGTFVFTVQVTDSLSATAPVTCSITITVTSWPLTDGGGGGWECPVWQCIPPPDNCPHWGPVSVTKQHGRYVGIYRDSLGQVRQFEINPHGDAVSELAAGVMRIERSNVNPWTNNPGRLRSFTYGQTGEIDGLAVFASRDDGVKALKTLIFQALVRLRRETY